VKVLRTIIWVLAAIGFLIFAIYNWQPVELTLWQNLVLETKVPVLALIAFTLGFVPLWAYHRSVAWGLNRRVRALETSLKNTAMARQAESAPMVAADTAVDKPGKSGGESADPFSGSDGADGGAGE
jgi:lipopolysaccharide assembly protein A